MNIAEIIADGMTRRTKKSIVLWLLSVAVLAVCWVCCLMAVALWTLHPALLALTIAALLIALIRYYLAESVLEFIYWKL